MSAQAAYFHKLRILAKHGRSLRELQLKVDRLRESLSVSPEELAILVADPLAYRRFNLDPEQRAEFERQDALKRDQEERRAKRIVKEREERRALRAASAVSEAERLIESMLSLGLPVELLDHPVGDQNGASTHSG